MKVDSLLREREESVERQRRLAAKGRVQLGNTLKTKYLIKSF